jgi:hypothetical protein
MVSLPTTKADARPLRSGGVMAAAMLDALDVMMSAPAAVIIRAAMTTEYVVPSAVTILPAANTLSARSRVERRFIVLVAVPSTGAATAKFSAEIVMSCLSVGFMSNDRTTVVRFPCDTGGELRREVWHPQMKQITWPKSCPRCPIPFGATSSHGSPPVTGRRVRVSAVKWTCVDRISWTDHLEEDDTLHC